MARTLHQAMAYLGLGQVEDDNQRAERRTPETVYEETVFMPDDQYEDYDDRLTREPRTYASSTADRDVLHGIASDQSAAQNSVPRSHVTETYGTSSSERPYGSVSTAEADELLELNSTGSDEWDLPATDSRVARSAPSFTPSVPEESSDELRRITTIHPRSYNDAKIIGESFRENIPVIMNVTDMGDADAKRLIDFSAGLAFALNGHIERVTDKVFLLTPANLEVLGAEGTEVPVALDSDDDVTPFNQV